MRKIQYLVKQCISPTLLYCRDILGYSTLIFITITVAEETVNILFYVSLSVCDQSILNSDENSHVLQNLDPDTDYSVTVTAIYPDESESEDLMGNQRTCKLATAPTTPSQLPKHNQHILYSQMSLAVK